MSSTSPQRPRATSRQSSSAVSGLTSAARARLAPPVSLGGRTWTVLWILALIAVGSAYQGSVPSASLTYIAKQFGNSTRDQSVALAIIRADIVFSVIALRFADRIGRRRLLLFTATVGPLLTAACAASPNLVVFTALQVLGRSMVTATLILIAVLAVEEVPAEARTWASAFLVIAAAIGSGVAVGSVFIADRSLGAWRVLFVIPLLTLGAVVLAARRLPESSRFVRQAAPGRARPGRHLTRDAIRHHWRRLALVSAVLALLAFQNTPARAFQNEYLRLDRGFTSKEVAIFSVLTNAPGLIGLVVGGIIGHRFDHRRILFVTIIGFAIGDCGLFLSHGSAVWWWSVFGALAGAASIPILSVLSAEVFPTSFRSTANGLTTAMSRIGGALGLLTVGVLTRHFDRGVAVSLPAIAIVVALVLIPLLPETRGQELEALNPEDLSPV